MNPWTIAGVVLLMLASVGVVLPLLPTTPFVLVAAACFARSSPRMHAWLRGNRVFGPMIEDWERKRCVSRRVKVLALVMMLGVGGTSIVFLVPPGWITWVGVALVAIGCAVVSSLRVCR